MERIGRPVAVSVPGKLILMGEHAVVYGRPALVAAVDLRLAARFFPFDSAGRLRIALPGLGAGCETDWPEVLRYARETRERWERYAAEPGPESFGALREADPLHLVKVALGEAATALSEESPPPLDLRVDSRLPVGSGMGSSAAAAVAVVAGANPAGNSTTSHLRSVQPVASPATFGLDASHAPPARLLPHRPR